MAEKHEPLSLKNVRNVDELLRAIKALQMADKYKAAVPANWPYNELIGDKVCVGKSI